MGDTDDELLKELARMEQAEKATKREIAALRETLSAHVDQAESLLKMYKLLLQRVDEVDKKAEKFVTDNTRLRALLTAKDARIAELEAKLAAAGIAA